MDFNCNVCGVRNTGVEQWGREVPSCSGCRSTVRIRALVHVFSTEVFGVSIPLPDFPVLKGLRGIGMTDPDSYAATFAERFDYRNTFFDRDPRLDITEVDEADLGSLDFLISSEVFEHVKPPFEKALENAFRLLKPTGVLILTVPYAPSGDSQEHFPRLHDSGVVHLRSGPVLVNRTAQGDLELFDQLLYHGGPGATLEMRRLTEAELRRALLAAGFSALEFYGGDYLPFGICHSETWSLPLAARKQPFQFPASGRADLTCQFAAGRQRISQLEAEIDWLRRENSGQVSALEERTAWARSLEADVASARETIAELQAELADRTDWARNLDSDVTKLGARAAELHSELMSRTEWAEDLDRQLQERTAWAVSMNERLQQLERQIAELRASKWNRLGRVLKTVK